MESINVQEELNPQLQTITYDRFRRGVERIGDGSGVDYRSPLTGGVHRG